MKGVIYFIAFLFLFCLINIISYVTFNNYIDEENNISFILATSCLSGIISAYWLLKLTNKRYFTRSFIFIGIEIILIAIMTLLLHEDIMLIGIVWLLLRYGFPGYIMMYLWLKVKAYTVDIDLIMYYALAYPMVIIFQYTVHVISLSVTNLIMRSFSKRK